MKIPKNLIERDQLYDDVIRKCLISRNDRMSLYRELRSYFLFGAQEGGTAPYNKIQPTIQLLRSFIYSAETTKYNLHIGATVDKSELAKVPPLAAEVNDLWHDSDTDLTVGDALTWSFVFNTTLIKVFWNKGIQTYMVEPDNFGVYREDSPYLERQEAVVHCYSISKSQLERELASHPQRASIMQWVEAGKQLDDAGFPSGLNRIMASSSYPSMVGGLSGGMTNNGQMRYDYNPKVDADLIQMYELYIWDDDEDDYRIVTRADAATVYDRKNFLVPKMLPFVKLCPEPLPYYFWGQSFAAKLTALQDWRTERTEQIKRLLTLQAKPPKALSGYRGIPEEKLAALNRPGGLLAGDHNTKVEVLKPDIPGNIFAEIKEIDAMFDDMAGVSHVMQGKGESGVRAKGHADLLARLSSARPKTTALIIEDALERIATLMLRCLQQHSDARFVSDEKGPNGEPLTFIAKQFTNDFVVKVDAHSSSPIFVEDRKSDAMTLLEAHAIDRQTLLEIFDPPGVQLLKERLKEMEKKEAEQQRMQAEAQAQGR